MPQASLPLSRPNWLTTHPRHWQPGTLDREALYAQAAALQAHPLFDQACQSFIAHWLRNFENPLLKRVVRNTPLYLLMVFAMYLHHRRDPALPASGVTLSGLQELFAHPKAPRVFASASRIKGMLAHARLQGMLRSVPLTAGAVGAPSAKLDRRARPLEPTERLDETYSRWIWGFMAGSALVLPMPVGLQAEAITPALVHEVFSYRIAGFIEDSFSLSERCQSIQKFGMRDHAYPVFLHLMQTLQRIDGQLVASAPIGELAQTWGVARATLRNALADAQADGHLVSERGGASVVLAPDFYATGQLWLALEMLYMHGLVSAALIPDSRRNRPLAGIEYA